MMTSNSTFIRFTNAIDQFVDTFGRLISWAYALLIAVIIVQVVLRYGFGKGLVILEELQWHLYAIGLMFGLSYGLIHDEHIRVDVIHMRLSNKAKHIIEIAGILLLLLPFISVVFIHSIDFFIDSWRINEHSNAPSGLPWRWAIKSVIPASFALLFLSAIARLCRETALLLKGE